MTQEMVDIYLLSHEEYFPADKLPFIRDKLLSLPEEKAKYISFIELQKPICNFLFSLFFGAMGVDRFLVGDIGLGILKLLTAGCCGIMAFVDLFLIMGRTKEKNFDKLWKALQ